MGHKVFISYKYGDTSVKRLSRTPVDVKTKVRDYVDEFQELLSEEDHINKGELDGEDLSHFKDETIESKLRDKIYDSTVTIVFISPNMKDIWLSESDQWIPWEVSYSLRETTRNGRTSQRNGMLAVVLPDIYGDYSYILEPLGCCESKCNLWHVEKLFQILRDNMFNKKHKERSNCQQWRDVYHGYFSYIHMLRWDIFIKNISFWIEEAEKLQENKDQYEIHVNVK